MSDVDDDDAADDYRELIVDEDVDDGDATKMTMMSMMHAMMNA